MLEKRKFDKETKQLIDNLIGKKIQGENKEFYDFLYDNLEKFKYQEGTINSEISKLKLTYEKHWPKFKEHYRARHIEDVLEKFENARNQKASH